MSRPSNRIPPDLEAIALLCRWREQRLVSCLARALQLRPGQQWTLVPAADYLPVPWALALKRGGLHGRTG